MISSEQLDLGNGQLDELIQTNTFLIERFENRRSQESASMEVALPSRDRSEYTEVFVT